MVWWRFKKDLVFPSLVFVFLLLISPQFTFAADLKPIDIIKTGSQEVLQILREPQGSGLSFQQRRDEILSVVNRVFRLRRNGQKSAGPPLERPSLLKSARNSPNFSNSFSSIPTSTGSRIIPARMNESSTIPKNCEGLALVKTHILYQGNNNVSIDYRLHPRMGRVESI